MQTDTSLSLSVTAKSYGLVCALAASVLVGCSTMPAPNATSALSVTNPGLSAQCIKNPLGKRDLYLRGSFNSWNATDTHLFTYRCDRFELVANVIGEYRFKVGDEDWSSDADFGALTITPGTPTQFIAKGRDVGYTFSGYHRFTFKTPDNILTIEKCPASPAGDATLYLRGSMNNWASLDDYAFTFNCDAYYLNVNLTGRQEFKIADAAWSLPITFGAPAGGATLHNEQAFALAKTTDAGGAGNSAFFFIGEHTLRLAFDGGKPQLTIGAKRFDLASQKAITDPVALSLRFDSRDAAQKSPFGAVTAGTTMNFALNANDGVDRIELVVEKRTLEGNQEVLEYSEVARVPMRRDGARWVAAHRFDAVSVYGYYFEAMIGGVPYVYANNRDTVYWTREKGSGGMGEVIEKPDRRKAIRRFRQTVFAADFKVPEWAPDVVYYYIFPDRFRNGDRANDPKPAVEKYQNHSVEFHKNWNEKPYKPGSGDGSDGVYNNDFFGGDLAGIIEKLDYIKALGANTIYMTPIFQAASNHKYDTADYKQVDPAFGTNEDFIRLTSEATKRGIRVIPDTSLNHVGSDSKYFDRFSNYAERNSGNKTRGAFEGGKIRDDSPYASWFSFDRSQSDPAKQFKGWTGIADLPELDKSSPAFRSYAYKDSDSVMKLWLDRGAAGWRMDVAPWVPDDFWREWRTAIKAHRPDALTIAEAWSDSSKYFLGDTFDSTMNYIFRNTVQDYAMGGNATSLYRNIELMREAYPPRSFYALMNLLSSHDQSRSLHQFGFVDNAEAAAIALAKQRLRLAVFFQMTFPGSPTVYYGDEVGVTGGDDPYNRATYPWQDTGGTPDNALLADFKQLIKLRNDYAVLRRGSIDAPLHIDANVIVWLRKLDDAYAIVATNNSSDTKTVTVTLPVSSLAFAFVDALDATTALVHAQGNVLSFTVPPRFGRVLVTHSVR